MAGWVQLTKYYLSYLPKFLIDFDNFLFIILSNFDVFYIKVLNCLPLSPLSICAFLFPKVLINIDKSVLDCIELGGIAASEISQTFQLQLAYQKISIAIVCSH